jgi:DNA-binding NtrC family response regulator
LRALLVEDNAEIAAETTARLEALGFDVAVAASARAALLALEAQGYALVVSDILMPGGMSGIDLVRELHARAIGVPVVLVSGYAVAAEEARSEGFTVLQKPFDELRLRAAIAATLLGASKEVAGG